MNREVARNAPCLVVHDTGHRRKGILLLGTKPRTGSRRQQQNKDGKPFAHETKIVIISIK
jgi:hypothetical protein